MFLKKKKLSDFLEVTELRREHNKRATVTFLSGGYHHFLAGESGTVVGEIYSVLSHGTGGYHVFLFVPDCGPGMVVPLNNYYVRFEE